MISLICVCLCLTRVFPSTLGLFRPRSGHLPWAPKSFRASLCSEPHDFSRGHTGSAEVFLFFTNLFIYLFWLPRVLVAACGTITISWGNFHCGAQTHELWYTRSWVYAVSSCSSQALAPGLSYCGWYLNLVSPWPVGSSQMCVQIHVPCIGRWILNHWATREVSIISYLGVPPGY